MGIVDLRIGRFSKPPPEPRRFLRRFPAEERMGMVVEDGQVAQVHE
jgi:hypothetical protein